MHTESYFLDEEDSLDVEKLDLRRYYRALMRKWWVIGLVTIVTSGPWLWYLKNQPPVYEAKARVQFKSLGGGDINLAQARTIQLTSRSFANEVVAELGLSLRVEKQGDGFINRSRIFSEFSTSQKPVKGNYTLSISQDQTYVLSRLDPETQQTSVVRNGYVQDIVDSVCEVNGMRFRLVPDYYNLPPQIKFSIINFRKAVESFQARTKVGWEDRSGTLMNVSLTDTDPQIVAEMTNRLAEVFIRESGVVRDDEDSNRLGVLREQLAEAKRALDESDQKFKHFKERYGVNLDSDQKRKLAEKNTLEDDKQRLEDIIEAVTDLLRQKEEQELYDAGDRHKRTLRFIMTRIAEHPAFNNNASMLVVREELSTLEQEWQNIASGTSPENFRAKKKLEEILKVHDKVESLSRRALAQVGVELSAVTKKVNDLEYQLSRLPARQQEESQLARDHRVFEEQYKALLQKVQEEERKEATVVETIKIMDPALPPEFPTNRDKKQKAAVGGVFAFFMGIGLVLVIEFLDKSLKTADDVKKHLRLPILGTIPQIDFEDTFDFQDSEKIKKIDQQLVTHDYSPTPIGEAYRSLRTNLMFTKDKGRIRSLVLTSNEPGDGKSFTAANLTITLAQLKSNTLLIDSDLRRGVLHNTFGVPKEPGFSNYLTDVVPLQSIIHETQIPNLSIISCGSLIPNPSELLGSHQMQRFLDEVRRKFDLVVFDTPPLNAATDAVVVGTQVDAVVLVIRAGKTGRDLAKSKLELFSSVPATLLGAVLNGTSADMAHPGYSYYHY